MRLAYSTPHPVSPGRWLLVSPRGIQDFSAPPGIQSPGDLFRRGLLAYAPPPGWALARLAGDWSLELRFPGGAWRSWRAWRACALADRIEREAAWLLLSPAGGLGVLLWLRKAAEEEECTALRLVDVVTVPPGAEPGETWARVVEVALSRGVPPGVLAGNPRGVALDVLTLHG